MQIISKKKGGHPRKPYQMFKSMTIMYNIQLGVGVANLTVILKKLFPLDLLFSDLLSDFLTSHYFQIFFISLESLK